MDEVIVAVRSTWADIVAITEALQCTRLKTKQFHHLSTNRRGGEVALFCRSSLSPSHFRVNISKGIEALWVRVTPLWHPRKTASVLLYVVYNAPRATTTQLLIKHIIDTVDALRMRFPAAKLVICGDFNSLDVSDILHQLHLIQIVDFSTH